jgi:hypothetical protein
MSVNPKALVSVLLGAGTLLLLARGCGSESGSAPGQDAGPTDATVEAAGGDGGTGAFGGSGGTSGTGGVPEAASGSGGEPVDAGCPPVGLPPEVPQDWESFTGYSCDCPVYIPGENGTPPPPIEWEPCPEEGPQDVDCRVMKLEAEGVTFDVATAYTRFSMDPSGIPLLQFARLKPNGDGRLPMQVVAEVDGQVRNAFLLVREAISPYAAISEALSGNRYAIRMKSDDVNTVQGLIAGSVGEPYPDYVTKLNNGTALPSNWDVSDQWILRKSSKYTVTGWDGLNPQLVYDPAQDPDGVPAHASHIIVGDIFFNVSGGAYSGTMSWTTADGLQPLLRWYGDPDRASGNFGTDGTDMVWTSGEGYLGNHTWDNLTIMTAPYTTDPQVAQASTRRLRTDIRPFYPWPFRVGCGYASRQSGLDDGGSALIVVRLSDGWSWFIHGKDPMNYPMMPLGLTCDELFLTTPNSIARVRLDSLGPGMAPD